MWCFQRSKRQIDARQSAVTYSIAYTNEGVTPHTWLLEIIHFAKVNWYTVRRRFGIYIFSNYTPICSDGKSRDSISSCDSIFTVLVLVLKIAVLVSVLVLGPSVLVLILLLKVIVWVLVSVLVSVSINLLSWSYHCQFSSLCTAPHYASCQSTLVRWWISLWLRLVWTKVAECDKCRTNCVICSRQVQNIIRNYIDSVCAEKWT